MLHIMHALRVVTSMRAGILRVRDEIRRPVGINGWCATVFTLVCVIIIRTEGHVPPGSWAERYFTALHFAENLLAIGFLYCVGAVIFGKGKDRLIPALGAAAALAFTPEVLALSLMFLPFLLTPRL